MIRFASLSLILCLWCQISLARKIAYEECGGIVKSVDVDPCDSEPCAMEKGSTKTISVHCVSNADAEKLKLTGYASLDGAEVPLPGLKKNGCVDKNITCPITNNQELFYSLKFEVKKFFPSMETTVRFELKTNDKQNTVICCFKSKATVIDAAS